MSSDEVNLRNAIVNLVNLESGKPSKVEQLGSLIATIVQAVVGESYSSDVNHTELLDTLSQAVQFGQPDILRELVVAETQIRQDNQPTLLMAAVMGGKTEIVRALVEVGADPNVRIRECFAFDAMQFAADQESLEMVKILADAGADLNWNDPGLRPLKTAIDKGNVEMLKILLDAGAEVVFDTGFNPLVEAASKSNSAGIIELLLKAGCQITSTNLAGDTALVNACLYGFDAVVRVLLTAGADANQTRRDGLSPMIALFSAPQMTQALSGWVSVGDAAGLPSRMATILQALVDAGVNLDTRDFQGRTALMIAAEAGRLDLVHILLAGGAEANAIVDFSKAITPDFLKGMETAIADRLDRKTALHYSAEQGHTEVVRVLLAAGADATIADKKGRTARDIATQQGYTDIAQVLQADAPLPDAHTLSEAFLLGAAKQGNLEDLRSALQAGIDPNASEVEERRNRHKTALMFAAERGHLEAVQILLDGKADVNLSDRPEKKLGKTPLMFAAKSNHAKVVRLLIESGARVDAQDKRGETALFLAVEEKCVETVQVLLEFEADPHQKGWDGTPFEAATYAGAAIAKLIMSAKQRQDDVSTAAREEMFRSAAFGGNAALVKTMIQDGINLNAPEKDGWTALIYAAAKGAVTIVQILVAAGADVNAIAHNGNTALSESAYWGHLEIVELLISAGANPNTSNLEGWTPLMKTLTFGSLKIVQVLINAGVDLNLRNQQGQTALVIALENNYAAIAQLLHQAGAIE